MSEKNKKQPDLSQAVMRRIKTEKIKMRPQIYFVLGSILFGAGLAGSLLVAIFFASLAFFRLHRFGPFGFLWFGEFGLRPFLVVFPWVPLTFFLAVLTGGLVLLKKSEISYQKSFLGLITILAILIILGGSLLVQVGFHQRLTGFRPLRPFYQEQFIDRNWVVGRVLVVEDNKLTLQTPAGNEVEVVWDERTLLPFGSDFEKDQVVRVVGQWQEDVFQAKGIGQGGMHFQKWPTPHPPFQGSRRGSVKGRFR